jgi:hypothetical protein
MTVDTRTFLIWVFPLQSKKFYLLNQSHKALKGGLFDNYLSFGTNKYVHFVLRLMEWSPLLKTASMCQSLVSDNSHNNRGNHYEY